MAEIGRDQIVAALDKAAAVVTDSDTTIAELINDAAETYEGMLSVIDAIEGAIRDLLSQTGYPNPNDIYLHFEVLSPFPDAYAPDEDIFAILVRCSDGKCLTLRRNRFGDWEIGRTFRLRDVDDAVEMVENLLDIVLNNG